MSKVLLHLSLISSVLGGLGQTDVLNRADRGLLRPRELRNTKNLHIEVTEPQAPSKSDIAEFCRFAFQGTLPTSAFDPDWLENPVSRKLTYAVGELRNCSVTHYNDFFVYTQDHSKAIVSFHSNRSARLGRRNPVVNGKTVDTVVPYKLSDSDADRIAQRVYNLAGYPGQILIRWRKPNEGNESSSLEIQYLPMVNGVPYETRATEMLLLDQETGQLNQFGGPSQFLPKPPRAFVPKISKEDAEWSGVIATASSFDAALLPGGGIQTALCLWMPPSLESTGYSKRWLSSRHLQANKNNEAILAYEMQFRDPRYGESRGEPNVYYFVYVDAISGKVVQINKFPDVMYGSRGRGTQTLIEAPLPNGQRTWKVGNKGGDWSGYRTGKFEEVSIPEFKPEANVLLATHNFAAPVEWDGARKLVRFGKTVYRPTGHFVNALIEKAKPPKE